jgi:hypothetical protein
VRRPLALLVVALGLAASTGLVAQPADARTASTPQAVNGAAITRTFRAAVAALPVSTEVRSGYERSKFKLWDDIDHDCQNTRAEVLIAESKKKTTGACTIKAGKWVSYYDDRTFTKASGLDIDHLVPLAEVWDSGGRAWSAAKREAYANDLSDARTLVAVSASANRSKGDRDPAEWMPADGRCQYALQWTVVKTRWALSVDAVEKATLKHYARICPKRMLTTHKAVVKNIGSSTGGGGGTGGGSGGAGLDPRFSTCTEAKAHGYGPYVKGVDPEYSWYEDRDHDGVVCE